jgi:hypothetical protein
MAACGCKLGSHVFDRVFDRWRKHSYVSKK